MSIIIAAPYYAFDRGQCDKKDSPCEFQINRPLNESERYAIDLLQQELGENAYIEIYSLDCDDGISRHFIDASPHCAAFIHAWLDSLN